MRRNLNGLPIRPNTSWHYIDRFWGNRRTTHLRRTDNNDVDFLDIKITSTDSTIYRKGTHTAQYSHLLNFTPWCRESAWLRARIYHAHEICSDSSLYLRTNCELLLNLHHGMIIFVAWWTSWSTHLLPKPMTMTLITTKMNQPSHKLDTISV